jgi:hypothetical protein
MNDKDKLSNALTGVLIEAYKQGLDIDSIAEKVTAGVMGGEMYAPAVAAQKPEEATLLKNSLAYAKKIIDINA